MQLLLAINSAKWCIFIKHMLYSSFPFSHHSVLHTENMENRKNAEPKTVIKTQKFDGCFLTSSLRKPPTSRLQKQ